MDQKIIDLLCCPLTKKNLRLSTTNEAKRIRDHVKHSNTGKIRLHFNDDVTFLIRDDGQIAYPIIDAIPDLLIESGLDVAQALSTGGVESSTSGRARE